MRLGAALTFAVALALAVAGCGGGSTSKSNVKNVYANPSKSASGQHTFSAPGMKLTFDFPPNFKPVPLQQERQFAGNSNGATHAGLAIGPYDLLIVSRYPGQAVPVTTKNVATMKSVFDTDVSKVLHQTVTSTVSTVNGLPLLTWPREPIAGLPVAATVQILNAFVGDDEYEIQCQATTKNLAKIESACREVATTLRAK